MIVKLLPNQIADAWDMIRAGVLISLPPIVEPNQIVLKNILTRLLCGDLQCWAIQEVGILKGHALTYIATDTHSKSKTLNIYSLYTEHSIQPDSWQGIVDSLMEFGKANKCFRLAAYTRVADIVSIAKRFGFNADYSYIIKDIKET